MTQSKVFPIKEMPKGISCESNAIICIITRSWLLLLCKFAIMFRVALIGLLTFSWCKNYTLSHFYILVQLKYVQVWTPVKWEYNGKTNSVWKCRICWSWITHPEEHLRPCLTPNSQQFLPNTACILYIMTCYLMKYMLYSILTHSHLCQLCGRKM